MATEIIVPRLGLSMEPITLVEWKAKEGDQIKQGDAVLVVESQKLTYEVEAESSGFLHILIEAGSMLPIGTVAGLIAETKEELEVLQKEQPEEKPSAAIETKEAPLAEAAAPPSAKTKERDSILISPVARKLAEAHMIDITSVAGTGPGGRIVREDVEKAIAAKGKEEKEETTPVVSQGRRVKSTIPLKGMRKAIAENMYRSLSISAQLTVMGEIDMTEMVKLRQSLVAKEKALGARITYTDLFVLVVARLLKEHPIINASLIDNEIKVWENINIGVATALEEGLIVPVVKDADKKSLVEISKTVRSLVQKAREGKLMPDEVTGGTFTITNLGALGGGYRFETVIINQPESAILGTSGITDRAVVRDRQIVIRPIMTYYFTYDHRVINGAVVAQFMADATRLLETPSLQLI